MDISDGEKLKAVIEFHEQRVDEIVLANSKITGFMMQYQGDRLDESYKWHLEIVDTAKKKLKKLEEESA